MTIKIFFAGLCIAAGLASCVGTGGTKDIVPADSAVTDSRCSKEETDMGLGEMQVHTYEGMMPAASSPGLEYKLTIRNREYSGDGTFQLTLTHKDAKNGEDSTFTYKGRRFTLRGIPGDDNATVWQCVADDSNKIFNFLVEDANTLTLLNDKWER